MDFNGVVQAISTVGFPIVMCLILLYYMNKNREATNETINELRETIANNTLTIQRLLDKLDDYTEVGNGKK